jgi:hypothetical protein
MPRILYDHLLTESGFDLLTEAGDALVLREIGMAGDLAVSGGSPGTVGGTGRVIAAGTGEVSGQPGTVGGTGRIISVAPPVTAPTAVHFIHAPATLRGRCTAAGQPGTATGTGRLTLVGKGASTGIPVEVTGHGTLTLTGHATITAPPARLSGRGDVIDEIALILALAA